MSESLLTPWGPYKMGGFEGCTDRDPEHCACATDVQPTCRICDEEIEPGQMAWSRQWPCYDTLPLDHREQDWDVISWHDDCEALPESGADSSAPISGRASSGANRGPGGEPSLRPDSGANPTPPVTAERVREELHRGENAHG